ncbi:MAG: hypothetical protein RLZZ187_2103 [Pseudomonadota bacterium]
MGPERGSVMLVFINGTESDLRLLSIFFDGQERLASPIEPDGWRVRREAERGGGGVFSKLLVAEPGRRPVMLRYRLSGTPEARSAAIEIEFRGSVSCEIIVRFADDGPSSSPCVSEQPATSSGTWIH